MIERWQTIKDFLVPGMFGRFAVFNSDGARFAYLAESDPASKTPKIQLTGIPDGSILLKMDQVQEGTAKDVTQPLFLVEGKHLRHRCDYILLTNLENKDAVIFVELKSKNFTKSEVTGKFKTCVCLLDFIASISARFFNTAMSFSPDSKTVCRYVLIYVPDKPIKNMKNKPSPRICHCTPDCYFKYPANFSVQGNQRIHYKELVKI